MKSSAVLMEKIRHSMALLIEAVDGIRDPASHDDVRRATEAASQLKAYLTELCGDEPLDAPDHRSEASPAA